MSNVVTIPKRCTCPDEGGCTEPCARKIKNFGNFQKSEVSGESSIAEMLSGAGDESTALLREIERLTRCLERANENHEHFERLYYLELQKNEDRTAP